VRKKIRLKHCGLRAEEAYSDWIKRFILHHGKCRVEGWGGRGGGRENAEQK